MTHSHWTIMAYQRKIVNKGEKERRLYGSFRFDDYVMVKVDALTEEEAIEKAKKVIKRKGYRVSEVFACEADHKAHEDMQVEAIATQRLMLKEFMGMKEK